MEVDGCGGGLEGAVSVSFIEEDFGGLAGGAVDVAVAGEDGYNVCLAVAIEVAGDMEFTFDCGCFAGVREGSVAATERGVEDTGGVDGENARCRPSPLMSAAVESGCTEEVSEWGVEGAVSVAGDCDEAVADAVDEVGYSVGVCLWTDDYAADGVGVADGEGSVAVSQENSGGICDDCEIYVFPGVGGAGRDECRVIRLGLQCEAGAGGELAAGVAEEDLKRRRFNVLRVEDEAGDVGEAVVIYVCGGEDAAGGGGLRWLEGSVAVAVEDCEWGGGGFYDEVLLAIAVEVAGAESLYRAGWVGGVWCGIEQGAGTGGALVEENGDGGGTTGGTGGSHYVEESVAVEVGGRGYGLDVGEGVEGGWFE